MTSEELRANARAIYARRRPDQTSPIKEDAELMVEALMDEVNALREMVRVTRESYNEARASFGSALAEQYYRRGAEVMRDACAARLIAFGSDRLGHAITREHAAEIVGGTPIPGEP
jgi:hypothetical protein